jgi:DNA (cytosine-5)-methyltransferase 1
MKILNLYAGIGGNRKLWGGDIEVVAVENNEKIAQIYQDFFPNDTVIVADAHAYLLEHYKEFDFIWSSPPCPTHSQLGRLRVLSDSKVTGAYLSKARYPDMKLYEEIILLKHFFKGKYCVENVIAYYEPLIKPIEIQRHHFWSNFYIPQIKLSADNIDKGKVREWEERLGFDLSPYKGVEKRLLLRNCVRPELGLHIFLEACKAMGVSKIDLSSQTNMTLF